MCSPLIILSQPRAGAPYTSLFGAAVSRCVSVHFQLKFLKWIFGNSDLLDLAAALNDLHHFRIAQIAGHWIFFREAIGPMKLYCIIGGVHSRLRRKILCHQGLRACAMVIQVSQITGAITEKPRCAGRDNHVSKFSLDKLVLTQLHTKLLAL